MQQCLAVLLSWIAILAHALAGDVTYGMNFDVTSTNTRLIPNCATDPNATVPNQAFLSRYASVSVRNAVQAELKDLRSSGFRSVRSIVQLYPGDHASGDLMNIYGMDGTAIESIRNYVRDVKQAGFDSLIIAFDTQGSAGAGCRKKEWGDCFDPATVSSAVNAEENVLRAAQGVSGISLRVDLLNEACISNSIPRLLKGNFTIFIRAASKMHAVAFPAIPATVSCQIERAADGVVATMRLLAENGDHMGFIDVHAYPGQSGHEDETLLRVAQSLGAIKLPLIFGETSYGNPDYQHLIVNAYRAAFHENPQELLFWPVRSLSNHCNFDVAQPYRLDEALGR